MTLCIVERRRSSDKNFLHIFIFISVPLRMADSY